METKTIKKPRPLTNKQRAFVGEYIKNKFNGVKAAQKAYNPKTYNSAALIATENIHKPQIRTEIEKHLNKILPDEKLALIHNRNIEQDNNISASNQALDMLYKIKGAYAPEKRESISAHLTGADLIERERLLLEELKLLDEKKLP